MLHMTTVEENLWRILATKRHTFSFYDLKWYWWWTVSIKRPIWNTPCQVVNDGVCCFTDALFFSDPGVNTGSFLVAFPHTGVSTNQVNESMRLSMRIHLGKSLFTFIVLKTRFASLTNRFFLQGALSSNLRTWLWWDTFSAQGLSRATGATLHLLSQNLSRHQRKISATVVTISCLWLNSRRHLGTNCSKIHFSET